jgi:chorismate mutase/prephenate dehydratase
MFGCIALSDEASAQKKLAASRQQIDAIDRQIVNLINQRAAVVKKIGEIKSAAGLPVAAPRREQQVLEHVANMGASGPFPSSRLKAIYATVLAQMRDWEQEQQRSAK